MASIRFSLQKCGCLLLLYFLFCGATNSATAQAKITQLSESWQLADSVAAKLDANWNAKSGRYISKAKRGGRISLRTNAMMLELHSLAAIAGHTGRSRQDDRISNLVDLFTTSPVYVTKLKNKQPAHLHFPHVPAWEGTYTSTPKRVKTNPQSDAKAARALLAAWRSRKQSGLSTRHINRIKKTVKAVANGKWYRRLGRGKNQINWNTDLFAANFEINRDRRQLRIYRYHLKWFIDRIGGPTTTQIRNLSRGYGFRFYPLVPRSQKNGIDTVEYANIVYSALGFYDTAESCSPYSATASSELNLKLTAVS